MAYYKSIRLFDNFYCYVWLGRGNNCNTAFLPGILRGERPHVLIDPGHMHNELSEPCFDSLTQTIEKDGFKIEDVGLVIVTHTHLDHFESAELVVKKSGALLTLSH